MQPIGKLVLNRTPTNFFAETEQVAFDLGNLVPGIDVTNDSLLQGRLFSYVDTQLTRLGGPNFSQIPINRPHAPVNDMGKCYHQAIRERQLRCLANIDPVLCAQVATGLGLPAPEPTRPLPDVAPSPVLSQLGREWPADGRMVGIVVDAEADLDGVALIRTEIFAAGMVPLLIAAHGGMVGGLPVQRTFATGRSIEFDALLLAGAPAPAPDALPGRDAKAGAAGAKAGAAGATPVDPRVLLLVQESWRHAKVIGGWGAGVRVLEQAGVTGAPGVVTGDSATDVLGGVQGLLAAHRVWDRFPASVS